MRLLAFGLVLLSLALAASSVLAQPPPQSTRDARALDAGLVVVDTAWSERGGRRATRVTAQLGRARPVELHAGLTVRTALASSGDTLLVVAFHGGDRPRAQAILADVRDGSLRARAPIALPLPAARGELRPSAAVAAPTPDGFTVLLQETGQGGASADVRTTMYRFARDGTLAPPREVAVPWALAALAWNTHGYHLAVLWGGWGDEHAGTARICLVTLSPEGAPEQHPWWASPFDSVGEVMLLPRQDGAIQLVWRRGDGRTIALHDASANGGWSVEPPAPRELATIGPDVPFAAVAREGSISIVTP